MAEQSGFQAVFKRLSGRGWPKPGAVPWARFCHCGCCLESDWPRLAEACGAVPWARFCHCEGLLEAALAEL